MASDSDLTTLTAAEMASAVAAGEISGRRADRGHLDRIKHRTRSVPSCIAAEGRAAQPGGVDERRAAGEPLGPLAGGRWRLATSSRRSTCRRRAVEDPAARRRL
jgi:Asp-tRNA(Asn)/Glu-tRNA(Gln) amidotransferase A subunit family amidase